MVLMKHRSHILFGAFLAATIVAGAASAGGAGGERSFNDIADLMTGGDLIEAKAELLKLDRDSLTSVERDRALELMIAVDSRLRHADPTDLKLQRARLSLHDGDLRSADRHAHAVRRADSASSAQRRDAAKILQRSAQMKIELEPMALAAIDQAVVDFEDGRYAQAKAGFDSAYRSGVRLTTETLRMIDQRRRDISGIEEERGAPFEMEYVPLGMLQPGQVTRRDDPTEDGGEDEPPTFEDGDEAFELSFDDDEADEAPAEEDPFAEALKFDAQRVLAEADLAYDEGRYAEALRKYEEAAGAYRSYLSGDESQRADDRIVEVRVQLQMAGGGILDQQIQMNQIQADQVRAEFDDFLDRARQSLATGEFERARQLAQQARLRITDARTLFSEDEFTSRIHEQTGLMQEIIGAEDVARRDAAMQRDTALEQQAQEEELRRREDKLIKIGAHLARVRSLQMEHKYEEALQIVDQILFLDPNNPAGLLMKDVLQDVMIYRVWEETQRSKSLSYAREFNEIQKSLVIPEGLVNYPPDWPAISFRRGEPSSFSESATDRRVLAEMDTKRIPATFQDNTLEDVLDFIATVTSLNVDVDWESLVDIGVDRDTLVTLNLQPIAVKTVLDRVLEKVSPDSFSRAGWAVKDGVLVVASDQDLRRNTFIVLYDVRDLLFDIPSYTEAPQLDLNSVLNQGNGGGRGSIFRNEQEEDGEGLTKDELKERIIEIIQTTVDFEGWRDNGGDTGIIQELNDNLIITNTSRNHRQINGLLRQLREVRSIQINVEATFLSVSQDWFEQIGFDLDVVFNATNSQFNDAILQQEQFSNLVIPSGGSGNTSLLPSDLVSSFFGGPRNGSTQEFVNTTPLDFINPPVIGVQPVAFTTTRPTGTSLIPANQNSKGIVESLISSSFATSILGLNPALGIAGTYLDDIQVDFLVEATQADRRNVVLNAPKLTFTNGHAANIFVVTQEAFVSDLNPIVGTNSVAFDPTISVVSTGFTLALDGVVSSDRRYVTMNVQTQLAQRIAFGEGIVNAQTGGGANNGAPSQAVEGKFQLPIVEVTSISTGATVPDRGTLLLGGQRISTEVEVETGVPVLSKIPIINRFFTNRIETKEEKTLLVLIKPTILIQNEEEEKNFPGLLDELQNRYDAGF